MHPAAIRVMVLTFRIMFGVIYAAALSWLVIQILRLFGETFNPGPLIFLALPGWPWLMIAMVLPKTATYWVIAIAPLPTLAMLLAAVRSTTPPPRAALVDKKE